MVSFCLFVYQKYWNCIHLLPPPLKYYWLRFRSGLWGSTPLSTIFQLYVNGFIGGGNWCTRMRPPTYRKSLTIFYHIMSHQVYLPWAGFELTTLVVIGCIGCYKSNYHTITTARYIMVKTSYIGRDDDVHFVLDQHAYVGFTVNSEIIAMFLLLQKMRLKWNHNN